MPEHSAVRDASGNWIRLYRLDANHGKPACRSFPVLFTAIDADVGDGLARSDRKGVLMPYANAPLAVEGRRRLAERCQDQPIAHVAAELGISRARASKWVNRYRRFGDVGLIDRSPTPRRSPTATPLETIALIELWRREHKSSASRISFELQVRGIRLHRRTVTRRLAKAWLRDATLH